MIKFKQFEIASELLEHYTIDEIKSDSAILESAGLSQSDIPYIEELNEGFLGRLLDKLKNAISKHIPGGKLKKVEAALKTYKSNMEDALEEELKLRKNVLGEKIEDKARRAKFDKMMDRVNDKLDEYKRRAEDEFRKMTRGEPERISDYISMRLAEVQAEVTKQELDAARDNAKLYTEEEQTKIKKNKAAKDKAAKDKAAEVTKKTEEEAKKKDEKDENKKDKKDEKDKKDVDASEMSINDKAYLEKTGKKEKTVYKRKADDGTKQEVEIVSASADKKQIFVKNTESGKSYWVDPDSLEVKGETEKEAPKGEEKPEKKEETKPEDKKETPAAEEPAVEEPDKKFPKGARVKYEDKKGNVTNARVIEQPTKDDTMVQIKTERGKNYPISKDRLERKKNKRNRKIVDFKTHAKKKAA